MADCHQLGDIVELSVYEGKFEAYKKWLYKVFLKTLYNQKSTTMDSLPY